MIEPSVAVIVVTYNSEQHISECLRSIEEQLPSDGSRIVVFDNASKDKTPEIIATHWPKVQLIRSAENLGFGRGCNNAVKNVNSKYVLLVNPDAVLQPGAVAELFDLARRFPAAGFYGGRSFTPEGRPEHTCFARHTLWMIWCNSTGLSQIFRKSKWLNPQLMGGWACDTEREVAVIAGCLLLVDRQAWDRLGGFDEQFFLYAEDSDLCQRAANFGYSPIITPEARIVHIGGASSPSKTRELVMRYRAEMTLIRKIWTGPRRLLAERMFVGGVLLRAALFHARSVGSRNSVQERGKIWSELWQRRQEWVEGW